MAVDDAYATVDEYKAEVRRAGADDDGVILRGLLMTTRWLEDRSGQFFNLDASVVDRLWRAKYPDLLELTYEGHCPGIGDTTGLVIKVDTDGDGSFADETAWAASDYELLPRQAALGPIAKPYDRIATRPGGAQSFRVGQLVQVTAKFGWPAVPVIAKEIVIEWLAVWRGESIRTTARVSELDEVETVSPYHLGQINRLISAVKKKAITF